MTRHPCRYLCLPLSIHLCRLHLSYTMLSSPSFSIVWRSVSLSSILSSASYFVQIFSVFFFLYISVCFFLKFFVACFVVGMIPGPVLVGWVLDQSCLIWSGGSCGSSGSCLLYSHDQMAVGIMLWWVLVSVAASALFFISSIIIVCRSSSKSLDLQVYRFFFNSFHRSFFYFDYCIFVYTFNSFCNEFNYFLNEDFQNEIATVDFSTMQ